MKLVILLTILLVAFGEVIPFDNSAVDKIFKEKSPALFLFVDDETADASILEAFNAYDQTQPSILLTTSTKNDGHGLYQRLAEYLGVNLENTPQVLLLNEKAEKFRFDGTSITAQQLAGFVERVNSGSVSPFLKSAPIPQPSDDSVQVVVGNNFKEVVLDSTQQVLVKFYAPWCGHCKTLAPHYEEAARRISNNPNVRIIKVDSTENEVQGVDIQGFPTLKYWRKDKSADPLEFNGQRNADGIIQWIKEHTQYEWVQPLSSTSQSQPEEQL